MLVEERKCITVNRKILWDKAAKKLLILAALFLGLQAAAKSCSAAAAGEVEKKDSIGSAMLKSLADAMGDVLYGQFMPGVSFAAENGRGTFWFFQAQVDSLFPLYGYAARNAIPSKAEDDEASDFRTIMLAEAEEGIGPLEEAPAPEQMEPPVRTQEETLEELLRAENEAAQGALPLSSFIPHTRQAQVDLEPLQDYETLARQFYIVDASTSAGSSLLDVEKMLAADMSISKSGEGPQILIYHTHSQEAFADSVPGDPSMTITGVGEHLAQILRETYGYDVLHHLGRYDVESRDDSYSKALPEIEAILAENPSIKVVIDLHRDAVPEDTRLVTELDGKPTARFMFFNGLSRTRKTGNITYLYNENLDANLALSFQMQLKAMEYYPGLTRKIYLKAYRYNMHLLPRCMLIEMGAQNNTVEEVMNACEPLAHILDLVLSGEV